MNNIYIYWVGYEYSLIKLLRNIMYLHSQNSEKYKVHLINHENIHEYIEKIPEYFYRLCPAHQADYVRVTVICERGGIWLDSDTLVMNNLESLFDFVKNKSGFFILENNELICNGVFGSKPHTMLMQEWKNTMDIILDEKKENIEWAEIGNKLLQNIYNTKPHYYADYIIFRGLDNMYPVNFDRHIDQYIDQPYSNYKNLIRDFQPIIVLTNIVYHKLAHMTEKEILDSMFPLNYFISKSLENAIRR